MQKKELVLSILALVYGLAVIVAAFIDKEAVDILLKLNFLGLFIGLSAVPVSNAIGARLGNKFGKK